MPVPLRIVRSTKRAAFAVLALTFLAQTALAADKPPLSPDPPTPLATISRVSATIEFGLPALAKAIEQGIPQRLATIDERVNCVHRRVLMFRVNANCDVFGFVNRTGGVSLYGRGDRVYGAVSIYGAAEGQGANRFTARIRGQTEARATIEAEARPALRKDWSLDLNFSDSFHWSEAPYLHVLGREVDLAPYVEPRIRSQLARVRSRALAAARKLNLRDKATAAWAKAFEPVKLADEPPVWLQVTPQAAAFAGVRANDKVLSGSLELSGSAVTSIGQQGASVTPTSLPPLGTDVTAPGTFDVILPVRLGYDAIKDKISQAIAALPAQDSALREVQVYPSAGKLVLGLRLAKTSDSDPDAGQWSYLSGALKVDDASKSVALADLDLAAQDGEPNPGLQSIVAQLKQAVNIDYGISYQNLLMAANQRLTRPLKDGFRMEGKLSSVQFDKALLLADGITLALRASGELKILYGM
ncbi:hypothetical protein ABIF63_002524 [Bradyrhizobium japonicum]|uniref:DUF4403 domain-containing protein n=1 Tax=Bradyrhizobium japonicum TaxID=375 RepID=A0ABV2RNA1_BRAJP|nr:DUF4403 family protein [Bradyrhizobium japonicum]WLB18021.1 DUF4403 family protein [Bradyrhizobium japonicum]